MSRSHQDELDGEFELVAKRVVVVGAGLSGLVCARTLVRNGIETLVFEGSDGPGGRIRTDDFEGFRIDRGFQVFFEAYLHARIEFDLSALDMKAYSRGALITTEQGFKKLDARNPLMTILNPALGLSDTIRLGLLAASTLTGRLSRTEQTTEQLLRNVGFSEATLQNFFRPFFGGIFLDPKLTTSSAQFVFHSAVEKKLLEEVCSKLYLVTPNLDEISILAPGMESEAAGRYLSQFCHVLIKGGHGTSTLATDTLFTEDGVCLFETVRLVGFSKRGTGCVLSSAILANLAKGDALAQACSNAKNYIHSYLVSNHSMVGMHSYENQ